MRRNTNDGIRFRDLFADVSETLHKDIFFDGVHRRAVSQEKDGHFLCGFEVIGDVGKVVEVHFFCKK